MTRRNWHYRFTPEALIEEIDGRCRVYGRWSWRFGVWDVDFDSGVWREVDVDWPVFDRRGVWLEPDMIRGPDGHPAHATWRFEARAAFALYFSEIPARLRRRAADKGANQWQTIRNAWTPADLESEQTTLNPFAA